MATYVRIERGTVVEVVRAVDDDWLDGRFHPQVATRWQRAPDTVVDGDVRDGQEFRKPPPPPLDERREQRIREARYEASRRRQVVLDAGNTGDTGVGLADFLSLTARAVASVRREARGRPNPGEGARLDALEQIADRIEAIDNARDAIISEIRASEDPRTVDVVNSPHWPVEAEEPNP